jgi:ubiquitin carboxyl-terminal hydrolase 48
MVPVSVRAPLLARRGRCTHAAAERRSRRARKNRQPVRASATNTLAELKLKVFEALGVHPANQRLYVRGAQLLEGEQATLAQVRVC